MVVAQEKAGKYDQATAAEIMKLLTDLGFSPDAPSRSGVFPVTLACDFSRPLVLNVLLDAGASINARSKLGSGSEAGKETTCLASCIVALAAIEQG